jgi:hypothetical protein
MYGSDEYGMKKNNCSKYRTERTDLGESKDALG